MADVTLITLGTRVVNEGVEEAKAGLAEYGAAGDKAEASLKRVRDASGQLSKAQQDVARIANEVTAAQRIQDAAQQRVIGSSEGLTVAQRQLASMSAETRAAIDRQLGTSFALADASGVAAKGVAGLAAASESSVYSTRNVVKSQIEAIAINERMAASQASSVYQTRAVALQQAEAIAINEKLGLAAASTAGGLGKYGAAAESAAAKTTTFQTAAVGLESTVSKLRTVLGLGLFGAKVLSETIEAQNAMAQLEAAVKSTGGSAGRTVQQIDALSVSLQNQSTFSDEAIKSGQTMLLTFDKISGVTFDRATQSAVDLATRLGGDVVSAAQLVGKALQEPDEGLAQLNRRFKLFSEGQKQAIVDMVDAGHAAEAQGVILAALETKFGGAAKEERDTLGGALKGLALNFGELFEVTKDSSRGGIHAIEALSQGIKALADQGAILKVAFEGVALAFAANWITKAVEGLTALGLRLVVATAETAAYGEAEVRLAAAQVAATAGTNAATLAVARYDAAVAATTLTARAATGAVGLFSSSLGLIGGPIGAAAIVTLLALRHAWTDQGEEARNSAGHVDKWREAIKATIPLGETMLGILQRIRAHFAEQGLSAKQLAGDVDVYKNALIGLSAEQLKQQSVTLKTVIAQVDDRRTGLKAEQAHLPQPGSLGFDDAVSKQYDALGTSIAGLSTQFDQLNAMSAATEQRLNGLGPVTTSLGSKVKELTDARQAEVNKLATVNAAYGQSSLAIKELEIIADAAAKKLSDAKDIKGLNLKFEDAGRAKAELDAITDKLTHLQLVAARNAVTTARVIDVAAYTASNAALVQATTNEGTLAVATQAASKAQQEQAATVAHLYAQVENEAKTSGELAAATQRAVAADIAATNATRDRAAAIERLKVQLESAVALDAVATTRKTESFQADIKGLDAAAQKYAANANAILQSKFLKDADIDRANAAQKAADATARAASDTSFRDALAGQVAGLNRETAAMLEEAAAHKQGQSALEALAIRRASDAAAINAQTDAAKKGTTATLEQIAAARQAAEAHEKAAIALSHATQAEKAAEQIGKNFIKSVQSDVGSFFSDIFTSGGSAAEKFWNSFKTLAIKTLGEIASLKFFEGLASHATPGSVLGNVAETLHIGVPPLAQTGAPTAPERRADNTVLAAGSGAQTVAGQSIVPQFALAATAAIGVASALNHLTGVANTTAEALDKQIRTFLDFQKGLKDYALSVNGSSVGHALAQNTAQADTLRDKANEALPGKRLQGERESQFAAISTIEAAKAAQIAKDFWAGITAGLNATKGPLGALVNANAALTSEYNAQLASAFALGATTEQTAQITELYQIKLKALADTYNEAQRQLDLTLDAREKYALGLTAEGDAIVRRAAEEKEIFDAQQAGWSAERISRLIYIQGLEDTAAATARAAADNKAYADSVAAVAKALSDARQTLVQALAAGPQGTVESQNAANLQPLLDKQATDQTAFNAALAQYSQDIATGADASKTAADYVTLLTAGIVLAGDAAGIAANAFQAAVAKINQGTSDIQQAVAGGFLSRSAGIDLEKQNFGFSGLSNDEIRALYKAPGSGTELTNQDRETNKNINIFFGDLDRWSQKAIGGAANNTATARPSGETTSIANAARVLTESTGNRMADYLASILIVEKEIRDRDKLTGGAIPNAINNTTNNVTNSAISNTSTSNVATSNAVTNLAGDVLSTVNSVISNAISHVVGDTITTGAVSNAVTNAITNATHNTNTSSYLDSGLRDHSVTFGDTHSTTSIANALTNNAGDVSNTANTVVSNAISHAISTDLSRVVGDTISTVAHSLINDLRTSTTVNNSVNTINNTAHQATTIANEAPRIGATPFGGDAVLGLLASLRDIGAEQLEVLRGLGAGPTGTTPSDIAYHTISNTATHAVSSISQDAIDNSVTHSLTNLTTNSTNNTNSIINTTPSDSRVIDAIAGLTGSMQAIVEAARAQIAFSQQAMREQVAFWQQVTKGNPFQLGATPFAQQPVAPPSFDRIDTSALDRWAGSNQRPTTPPSRTIQITGPLVALQITQQPGEDVESLVDRIVDEAGPRILKIVNEGLASEAAQEAQRDGNPLVTDR